MRLDDFNFAKLPNELQGFKEDITSLLNNGKHQWQVVSTAPTFAGRAGEAVVMRSGTDGRLYIYLGSSWNVAVLFTADAS